MEDRSIFCSVGIIWVVFAGATLALSSEIPSHFRQEKRVKRNVLSRWILLDLGWRAASIYQSRLLLLQKKSPQIVDDPLNATGANRMRQQSEKEHETIPETV